MNVLKRNILIAIAAVVLASAAAAVFRPELPTLRFFAVGQGDAALMSSGRVQVLIDGGPDRMILSKLGRSLPFFDRNIEYVILTHAHADHAGGLVEVLKRYRVGRLILAGPGTPTPEFGAFRAAAVAAGIPVTAVAAGRVIRAGEAFEFKVLAPPAAGGSGNADLNDSSIVLSAAVFCPDRKAGRTACGSVMFTGDAPAGMERRLLAAGADLRADILKVGHHGSRRSTSAAFLAAVSPSLAVVSVGRNSYGHPDPSVLRRLAAAGARILRTDRDGDVLAVFRPDAIRTSTAGAD